MRRLCLAIAALIAVPLALPACGQDARTIDLDTFQDKLRGAWAGQMIGVSYGAPYEFRYLGLIMDDPIREWEPGFVDNSIHQDDLYVEMTFLRALELHGLDVTYEQAGQAFADSQYPLWHANYYGRENCRNGIMPPLSGHPEHNAHFDDIDYQIEADFGGIICPGMPHASNAISDIFGHVMNYGDGVYGGMWVAAMYAEAYFEDDVETVVRRGLESIPSDSTYALLIEDVLDYHGAHPQDWRGCWRMLEDQWGDVDVCPDGRDSPFNIDAKLNGGYIAMGLLYGDGDFERTLEVSTRCGQDNDCNPSNAAGILGCTMGYESIPEMYRRNIDDIAGQKFSHTEYSFDSLTEVCTDLAREVLRSQGGRIERRGGAEIWHVPTQAPQPPPLEQYIVADAYADLSVDFTHGEARLSWEPVAHARRYAVLKRKAGQGAWLRAAATEATSWTDTGLEPGTRYEYALSADLAVPGEPRTAVVTGGLVSAEVIDTPTGENLALMEGAWADAAITAPLGSGLKDVEVIRNGVREENYDSFDGADKRYDDWYAIRFPVTVEANRVVYTEGKHFDNGGWWLSLRLEALDAESMEWRTVERATLSPQYDFTDGMHGRDPYTTYTFEFPATEAAGFRIIGEAGGSSTFTSIGELEVYLDASD
ncbi:MAG: hypothetical protein GF320_11160 [Armatimonadia bacterium]|nr:hypothetical protein [Armatimonadia bacterium]